MTYLQVAVPSGNHLSVRSLVGSLRSGLDVGGALDGAVLEAVDEEVHATQRILSL